MCLRVFVYGTLKRGQSNHERFCQGTLEIIPATVRGRLYDLPYGFPGLMVPAADIRAVGTQDPVADLRKQHRTLADRKEPSSEWDAVYGELITFEDPESRLLTLDALEGYTPGERNLYERVLIPTRVAGEVVLAWAYRVQKPDGIYLPEGDWPARSSEKNLA